MSDDRTSRGGRIECTDAWPSRPGTKLYAHEASILPPIDAVFGCGSADVERWINSFGWERGDRYNENFGDRDIVRACENLWMREFPLYTGSGAYAVLGGWHWPCADDDWPDLIDDRLLVMTFKDVEPWIEAWLGRDHRFQVIQRTT